MRSKFFRTAAAMLFLVLAGCPDRQSGESRERPFAGQEIRIAVPAGFAFQESWDAALKEWTAQSGANCELVEFEPGKPEEPFSPLSTESGHALAVFPLERLGEVIAAGHLATIPDGVLRDPHGVDARDLLSGLRESLMSPGKQPSVIPISCPVLVCYYRRDLLEKAGLSPPQTWDDYQRLVDKLDSWAPGLEAVEPWDAEFTATMFLARGVTYARHPGHYSLFFDIESGEPLIDSPGFIRGLEASLKALRKMSIDVAALTPTECRALVLSGHAALAIGLEPIGGLSPISKAPAESAPAETRRGEFAIGICRLPGSPQAYNPSREVWEPLEDKSINHVTLCGFAGYAVGASAGRSTLQIEAAWNALTSFQGSDFTAGFPSGVTSLCRESQVSNYASQAGPGLQGPEADEYVQVVAESLRDPRLVIELPVIRRDAFRRRLAAALRKSIFSRDPGKTEATPSNARGNRLDAKRVTTEGIDAKALLESVHREWRDLVDEIGAEKLRDGYRASLGLYPLNSGH